MNVGGWDIFAHPLFLDQFDALAAAVERSRQKHPDAYAGGHDAKMLAAVLKLAFTDIPADPAHKSYEQGSTLGPARRHWRRAKFFQQYRLFFRFNSAAKIIVLAWVNDDGTRRAYDSRTDAYAVFAKMLGSGEPPDDWDALLARAKAPPATRRLASLGTSRPR